MKKMAAILLAATLIMPGIASAEVYDRWGNMDPTQEKPHGFYSALFFTGSLASFFLSSYYSKKAAVNGEDARQARFRAGDSRTIEEFASKNAAADRAQARSEHKRDLGYMFTAAGAAFLVGGIISVENGIGLRYQKKFGGQKEEVDVRPSPPLEFIQPALPSSEYLPYLPLEHPTFTPTTYPMTKEEDVHLEEWLATDDGCCNGKVGNGTTIDGDPQSKRKEDDVDLFDLADAWGDWQNNPDCCHRVGNSVWEPVTE